MFSVFSVQLKDLCFSFDVVVVIVQIKIKAIIEKKSFGIYSLKIEWKIE